ncbi:MAG: GNAT family N-acetyltransferase [Candidatus Bathyarchaeia archaeon]
MEKEDAPQINEVLNSVIREEKYWLDQKELTNLETEQYIEMGNKTGMRYLAAKIGGKIVGGAVLSPGTGKEAHVAQFCVFIHSDFRGLGLGTILAKELIEVAEKSGLESVQLFVFSTNKRAIHVYKKCNFKICGKFTRDIRFSDGTYADKINMELRLKP